MRNRKFSLAKIGAVLVALAGVASAFYPEKTAQFTQLAASGAALMAAIAAVIGWEDAQQANAAAQIEVAKIQKGGE